MIKIAPSIFACDFLNIGSEIKKLEEAKVDFIHFDVMDGLFVPNLSFGCKFIQSVKKVTKIPFDVHLMIHQPERYIKDFTEAGADIITFHSETTNFPIRLIEKIKEHHCQAGISINPGTPVDALQDVLPYVDLVLIMSVEPGFYGQEFIETTYERLRRLKKNILENKWKTVIEVDGGVNQANSKSLSEAGADILVIGADLFKQSSYQHYVQEIKNE